MISSRSRPHPRPLPTTAIAYHRVGQRALPNHHTHTLLPPPRRNAALAPSFLFLFSSPFTMSAGEQLSRCVHSLTPYSIHAPSHPYTRDPHRLDGIDNSDAASIAPLPLPEPKLPDLDLPQSELDLTMTFDSIFAELATKPASEPE